MLGELFHPLQFFQNVFRQQAAVHAFQVGGNGSGKLGKFPGISLEAYWVYRWSVLLV